MKFAAPVRGFTLATLLAVGLAAQAQSPLEVIPADAKVVVLVNNLERTMQSSQRFARSIGLDPPDADAGALGQQMGELGSQWKVNRGVALAVMQPGQDGVVAVFPVDDAAAALKAVKAETKGDVGAFDLFGQSVFGLPKGKNLLVSAGEASLKAFSGEKTLATALTPAQAKFAESSSVFVYLNIQALKPMIEQGFNDGDQLKRLFERLAERHKQINPEQAAEATKRAIKALSEQAKSVYLGLQIDEKAALTRIGVELLPDSRARGRLANFTSSGANLFGTLPATNFVAAFGLDAKGLAGMNPGQQGPNITGVSGALGLDQGGAVAMIRVDSPDAASLNEQLRGLVGLGQGLAAGQAQGKVEFVNNQKKVGGTDVGEVVVKLKDAQPKGQQAMTAVLGGSDVVIQHGVIGQAVGVTISGKPDAFTSLQAGGSLSAAPRVSAATGMLPTNSVFTLLVDPVSALQLAKRGARATGQETPIATANIPESGGFPIGAALSVEQDGVVFHIAVPAAAVKDVLPIVQKLN